MALGKVGIPCRPWWGDFILGCSDSERDLGVMMNNQMNMISQCDGVAQRANGMHK